MSTFEFVSVILSVIFALCISHLLIGVSALAKARGKVRSFAPHSVWLVATFLGAVQVWWSQWDFRDLEWSFPAFFYVLLAPTLLFFAIGLLIPDRIGEDSVDLKDHFSRVRHLFLAAMLVFVVLTWLDGPLLAGQPLFGRLGLLHPAWIGALLVGLATDNARVQTLAASAFVFVTVIAGFVVRFHPGASG